MATVEIDLLPSGQKVQNTDDSTLHSDNVGIGAGSIGSSGVNVLYVGNGTAPTTYPADEAQAWCADISAANAAWHFAGEGAVAAVMKGGLTVQQKVGTPGTDEIQIAHDGSDVTIKNLNSTSNGFYFYSNTQPLFYATGAAVIGGEAGLAAQSPNGSYVMALAVNNSANAHLGTNANGTMYFWMSSGAVANLSNAGVFTVNGGLIASAGGVTASDTAGTLTINDCQINRAAANVFSLASGDWFQLTPGEAALESDYTRADATMTSTALSVTLLAGRSYRIECCLKIANSTAADGIKVDFNGGTATITTFFAGASFIGSVTAGVVVSEALDTDLTATVVTGTDMMIINGYIEVDGAGTFILRAAEVVDGGGTLTVGAGSWMALYDTVDK